MKLTKETLERIIKEELNDLNLESQEQGQGQLVYLVYVDYGYEGKEIIDVYSNRESAQARCDKEHADRPGYPIEYKIKEMPLMD